MRTKALLIGAAIGAIGLASSMAQVYSVNVVGYVNIVCSNGFSIICNPLKASPDNTIKNVIPNPGRAITVYTFQNASSSYLSSTFDPDPVYGGWSGAGSLDCSPGIGLFVLNNGTDLTLTFVGDVPQGTAPTPLSTPIYKGFNLVASQVPQAGKLSTDLGYVPSVGAAGDKVYKYQSAAQAYADWTYDPDPVYGGWIPSEPTLDVGQGCFILRGQTGAGQAWTRSFSVN